MNPLLGMAGRQGRKALGNEEQSNAAFGAGARDTDRIGSLMMSDNPLAGISGRAAAGSAGGMANPFFGAPGRALASGSLMMSENPLGLLAEGGENDRDRAGTEFSNPLLGGGGGNRSLRGDTQTFDNPLAGAERSGVREGAGDGPSLLEALMRSAPGESADAQSERENPLFGRGGARKPERGGAVSNMQGLPPRALLESGQGHFTENPLAGLHRSVDGRDGGVTSMQGIPARMLKGTDAGYFSQNPLSGLHPGEGGGMLSGEQSNPVFGRRQHPSPSSAAAPLRSFWQRYKKKLLWTWGVGVFFVILFVVFAPAPAKYVPTEYTR